MTKLVCRLLSADGALLGWCEHVAAMRGDGCLRAQAAVSLHVEAAGVFSALSVHWADMNVETRVAVPDVPVTVGQALTLFAAGAEMMRAGMPPTQRLPPVSTKSGVAVPVPVGQLGSTGVAA